MNNYVIIQLKDICNYGDSFEYEPFIVIKDKNFEEKYNKFVKICKYYEDFQEVEDFINNNFEKIGFEKRYVEV